MEESGGAVVGSDRLDNGFSSRSQITVHTPLLAHCSTPTLNSPHRLRPYFIVVPAQSLRSRPPNCSGARAVASQCPRSRPFHRSCRGRLVLLVPRTQSLNGPGRIVIISGDAIVYRDAPRVRRPKMRVQNLRTAHVMLQPVEVESVHIKPDAKEEPTKPRIEEIERVSCFKAAIPR